MIYKQHLKIGIVGAGSMGHLLGVLLSTAGYNVEIVSRRKMAKATSSHQTYNIVGDFGEKTCEIPTVKTIEDFSEPKDFIIICTKVYDMIDCIRPALTKLTPNGSIVTIQNIFSIDHIAKMIPGEKSICMYMDINSYDYKGFVTAIDTGGVTLGVYNRDAFDRMKVFEQVMLEVCKVKITENVFGFVLGRCIINGAIASLGAISGMCLGDILNDRNGRYLFRKIIQESMRVFKKFKIKVMPYNDKFDYYLFTENTFRSKVYAYKMMNIIGKNNKCVRSSVLNDLENGNRTEMEFVLGNIINYGRRLNIKLSYINGIHDIIKQIERGERRINANALYDKRLVSIRE